MKLIVVDTPDCKTKEIRDVQGPGDDEFYLVPMWMSVHTHAK